jgi:hypothetical protein
MVLQLIQTKLGNGYGSGKVRRGVLASLALAGLLMGFGGRAEAQTNAKLGPAAPVTYDNRYEVYGGLNYMNFQAGQNLPSKMNFGGAEFAATYWFTNHLGGMIDYRGDAGTTAVFPTARQVPYSLSKALVLMNAGLAGVQYRGPKNHYAAIDYHALFGVGHGTFSQSRHPGQPDFYEVTGLYSDRTKPMGALGVSVDFNGSKNLAFRLQPDLILEHFGTETRQFFAISGGVIYRFGKR